jgi:adenylate cyclase
MAQALKLSVLENDLPAFEVDLTAPLELGRQRGGEPEPYALLPATATAPRRLVIARQQESNCSRQHIRLDLLPSGAVRVANGSQIPLPVADPPGRAIPPNTAAELTPPFYLSLPPRTLAVGPADSVDEYGVQGLSGQTVGPGNLAELSSRLRPPPALSPSQLDDLIGWLQTTMGVLQSAVGSVDFFEQAAEALVQIVGLDSGRVLLLEDDRWDVAADHGAAADGGRDWRPSRHMLDRVRGERRTFWQHPQPGATDSPSLRALQAVVAAPLLDSSGRVIGALYGERGRERPVPAPGGGKVEAILVELLACGVATGLARQEQERAAVQAQVRFEQFFGPQLARHLQQEPDLLEGREVEVTLLFGDIRGFSRVSERLGPAGTVRWVGDVMGELSDCVLAEGGVLVDYVGDELLAMWGAPRPQEDQASRGVAAALAMLRALAVLNGRWGETLGGPMDLGIGLNTGLARVGNTGSRHKFKYGPLGNAVNLASRVQGLTKYLKCRLLVTAATRQELDGRFIARRVCRARVVNIAEPVGLYEVEAAGSAGREEFFRASESALDALEAGEFALAARRAGALLGDHPGDGPLLLVLARSAQMLMQGGPFDAVWEPPGK